MKRVTAILLVLMLMFQFMGCSFEEEEPSDTYLLYYIRSTYQYHAEENVIVGEARPIGLKSDDIQLLVEQYLEGPISTELASPFPKQTELMDIRGFGTLLAITLSDTAPMLSDAQFSLACVCLGMSVLENTDFTQISFVSGDRVMDVDAESFLLTDGVGDTGITEEET